MGDLDAFAATDDVVVAPLAAAAPVDRLNSENDNAPLVLYVRPGVFAVVWSSIVALHAITAALLATQAHLYVYLADRRMTYYTNLIKPDIGSKYHAVAAVFGLLAAFHMRTVVLLVYASIRQRELAFSTTPLTISAPPTEEPSPPSWRSRLAQWRLAIWGRHGLLGVESRFFFPYFYLRECIELASQLWQAYRGSLLVSRPWINHLCVAIIVLNCWFTPALQIAYKHRPEIRRLAMVSLDAILDFGTAVVVPVSIFFPYYRQFNHATRAFPLEKTYDEAWFVAAVLENQEFFVVSVADLVFKCIPHVSITGCLNKARLLIEKDTRREASVVAPHTKHDIAHASIKQQISIRDTKADRVNRLVRKYSGKLVRLAFVGIGCAVLAIHLKGLWTSYHANKSGCEQEMQPFVGAAKEFVKELRGYSQWSSTDITTLAFWFDGVFEDFRRAVDKDVRSTADAVRRVARGEIDAAKCRKFESRGHIREQFSFQDPQLQGVLYAIQSERLAALQRPPVRKQTQSPPNATGHGNQQRRNDSAPGSRIPREVLDALPRQGNKSCCMRFLSNAGCFSRTPGRCTSSTRAHFVPAIPPVVRQFIEENMNGVRSDIQQCATAFACSIFEVDCHRLNITGGEHEVRDTLSHLYAPAVAALVFSHCPALVIPVEIQAFKHLLRIDIYNSSITQWDEAAALSNAAHPSLATVVLARVHFENGELPPGLVSWSFPDGLRIVEISASNLERLPEDLHNRWHYAMTHDFIEHSNLRAIPTALHHLDVEKLSLEGNAIASLDPAWLGDFEHHYLTLSLSCNPQLTDLPSVILPSTSARTIRLHETNLSALPDWIRTREHRVRDFDRVFARQTPLCEDTSTAKDRASLVDANLLSCENDDLVDHVKGSTCGLFPLDLVDLQRSVQS